MHLDLIAEDALSLPHGEMTRGEMVPVGREELGHLVDASLERVRTSRVERAARGDVDQRGRQPTDRFEAVEFDIDAWDRAEESPGVGMLRAMVDVIREPLLHQLARLHHLDVIAIL